MNTARKHDPLALFAFALRERDWVLADLLARALGDEPELRNRLEEAVKSSAAQRATPPSLPALRAWAQMSRMIGIGDGEPSNGSTSHG